MTGIKTFQKGRDKKMGLTEKLIYIQVTKMWNLVLIKPKF